MKKFCNFLSKLFPSQYLFLDNNIRMHFESDGELRIVKGFIKKMRPYTMLPTTRLLSLYTQVKYCEQNNIKGDYMECGVWKGGAVGLMALTNQLYATKRRHLFLFDSFDDICPPDPQIDGFRAIQDTLKYANKTDLQKSKSSASKPMSGFYASFGGKGTLSQNKKLFFSQIKYDRNYVHFYKGWFEDTMPMAAKDIGNLSILRIDADWYKSVYISLKYFYPKVVKGGFIIIDDYGYYEGCTKAVKKYFLERNIHLYPNSIDSGCVYFIK